MAFKTTEIWVYDTRLLEFMDMGKTLQNKKMPRAVKKKSHCRHRTVDRQPNNIIADHVLVPTSPFARSHLHMLIEPAVFQGQV